VPEIGVEPIHSCERQILSLLRLPIPPPGRGSAKVRKLMFRPRLYLNALESGLSIFVESNSFLLFQDFLGWLGLLDLLINSLH
jgi:hypothetical protein